MKQADAIAAIRQKDNTRAILQGWLSEARMKTTTGEAEYVCPLCGHGAGDDASGDGLVFNPKSQNPGALRCFKCGFSGDVIDLHMKKTGENFPRAVESLAHRLGIVIDGARESSVDFNAIIENGKKKQEAAAAASSGALGGMTSGATDSRAQEAEQLARDIAEARARINENIARLWLSNRGLGLDPAGRIFAPEYNLGFTDNWRGTSAPRVLIPTGPCSYFLRDLRADKDIPEAEKKHAKKDKGAKCLFNARALLGSEPVFICEGEIDALSVIEVGGGLEAVGLGGISEINQLLDFMRVHDVSCPLIISLDTDGPGQKAAETLCNALRREGRRWMLNNISGPYKDPNERLQHDREMLARVVASAAENARGIPFLPVKEEPGPAPTVSEHEADGAGPVMMTSEAQANETAAGANETKPEPAVAPVNQPVRPTVGLLVLGDFVSRLSQGSWLIDRWIPASGLSMVFGAPGTFKSFFALDIALTLGTGLGAWKGNPVRRLDDTQRRPAVVYLAGEGHASLIERTLGWIKHYNEAGADEAAEAARAAAEIHGAGLNEALLAANNARRDFAPITPADLNSVYFSQRALDMFSHNETQAIIEDIKALDRPVELIIVDTLARFFNGDENSAQDAGQLIGACGQLQDIFGAAVLLIHHSGVAADAQNRSRGSSAFLGALDTQVKLDVLRIHEDGRLKKIVGAVQKKQKNIDEADPLWLEPVTVPLDNMVNPLTLKPISTAVLVPHKGEGHNKPAESDPEIIEKTTATDDDLIRGDW